MRLMGMDSKTAATWAFLLVLLASFTFSSPLVAAHDRGSRGNDRDQEREYHEDLNDEREVFAHLRNYKPRSRGIFIARSNDVHFEFLKGPSAQGIAGVALSRAPWLLVVDGKGRPQFSQLKDLSIRSYTDPTCTDVAPAGLRARASVVLANIGIAAYKSVIETSAGAKYFKISARGVRAACSSLVKINAAAADHLIELGGNNQSGAPGAALRDPAQVRVVDVFGNAVSEVGISFAATSGGGLASPAVAVSDANGVASAEITLGVSSGVYSWAASRASGALPGNPSVIDFTEHALEATPSPLPLPVTRLALSGPAAQVAGVCSAPFTVTQRDTYGNLATSASATQVALGGNGDGSFYADSTCAGTAQSSLIISGGSTSATFYFRGERAESLLLAVSAVGLTDSVLPFTVHGGEASRLLIVQGDAQSAIAGQPVPLNPVVRATDAFGNAVSSEAVSFTVASGGGSVSANWVVTDGAGLASVEYTLGEVSGLNQLIASTTAGATALFSATAISKTPVAIALSGESNLVAGICSAAYSVQLLDDSGASASTYTNRVISLSGEASGVFYSDGACTSVASSVTIAAGQSSAQFYFRDTAVESVTLASQATGLSLGSVAVSISAAAASRLAFSVSPSSWSIQDAFFDSQPVISAFDSFGNTATSFSDPVTLSAYSDPACLTLADGALKATANPVSAHAGQAAFTGLGYDAVGIIYLGGSSGGLTSACSVGISVSSSLALAAGTAHSCALKDGNIKCWGFGTAGTLGNGASVNASTPQQVVGLTQGAMALGAGGQHSCASTATGVYCWGLNASGQLGDGTFNNRNVPIAVSGLAAGITQVVGGDSHTCALINGGVRCWGDNTFGQLGNGSTALSATPVTVQGLPGRVRTIAAASVATCAVLMDASAYCWGYNNYGQLGDGTIVNRSLPVRVQGLGSVKSIAPGVEHTCALVGEQVYCWGHNTFGQLGSGDLSDSVSPRLVQGFSGGVTHLLSGGQNFNCAIAGAGAVQCWGQNTRGQLGDNKVSGTQSTQPVQVVGLTYGMTALHAGYIHACASEGGGVKCWGWGSSGQLGNGATSQSSVPVSVIGY